MRERLLNDTQKLRGKLQKSIPEPNNPGAALDTFCSQHRILFCVKVPVSSSVQAALSHAQEHDQRLLCWLQSAKSGPSRTA